MEPKHLLQHAPQEKLSAELRILAMRLLHGRLSSLAVYVSDLGIILQGNCDSLQAKQLAQEIVTISSSLPILSNDLVVCKDSASLSGKECGTRSAKFP
jgi:hypothetical protein